MEIKTKTIFYFLFFILISCEEKIDLPFSSKSLSTLVVEGILTNEKLNHRIKLTHTYLPQNGTSKPATGAVVSVTDGNSNILLTEFPFGSGEYYTPQMRAVFGKTYTLSIQYQGRAYLAQDSSVPVEPLTDLNYRNVDGSYTLELDRVGQDPNYIDHQISWLGTPSCVSGASCEGRIVYYDLKTIDVNEIFKPNKAQFVFPVQSIVIRRKYSVSPAYKIFLRSVLSETEWRGGVFDVQRADVTTNLSDGGIGFFAVSTIVSDTTVVVERP